MNDKQFHDFKKINDYHRELGSLNYFTYESTAATRPFFLYIMEVRVLVTHGTGKMRTAQ